ncbi:ALP1-like protein [Tanacetum coccineum]
MSSGNMCHRGTNILTENYVGPTVLLGIVAGERIPVELSPSNIPQRHVARERYPQRQVARESPELSLGIVVNVVCTSAIRKIAYGAVPDALDEYLQMGATTTCTNDHKRILYKMKHETAKKDVERAFGVLKKKWKLIKHPARGMSRRRLSDVMYTCIILHNMIIHDNEVAICSKLFREEQHRDDDPLRTHQESIEVTREIINRTTHLSLKADLVKHIWDHENQH